MQSQHSTLAGSAIQVMSQLCHACQIPQGVRTQSKFWLSSLRLRWGSPTAENTLKVSLKRKTVTHQPSPKTEVRTPNRSLKESPDFPLPTSFLLSDPFVYPWINKEPKSCGVRETQFLTFWLFAFIATTKEGLLQFLEAQRPGARVCYSCQYFLFGSLTLTKIFRLAQQMMPMPPFF